jgi:sarcosine oxidase, subunit beta
VTRELVRLATKLGVEVREGCDATTLEADTFVIACGPWSAQVGETLGVELPVRPLVRQLLATGELELPERLPMVLEEETGFHFRRRGRRLVLAMVDPEPRWGFDEVVDESLFDDRLARLHHRYPGAGDAAIEDAWAGLYDMTPDAHPILGRVADGVYAACGFSGHGFMQSPAVGRAVAEEILGETPSLDLGPYRLARFEEGVDFPETLVL